MTLIRSKLHSLSGAICVMYALLAFAGVHLLHHHFHHPEAQLTPGLHQGGEPADHAHQAVCPKASCPVCSMLAHSVLDRAKVQACLIRPRADRRPASFGSRSFICRDLTPTCSPRAPPLACC